MANCGDWGWFLSSNSKYQALLCSHAGSSGVASPPGCSPLHNTLGSGKLQLLPNWQGLAFGHWCCGHACHDCLFYYARNLCPFEVYSAVSQSQPTTWPRCRLAQCERGQWHSSYVSSPFTPLGASPCPLLLKAEMWHRGKPKILHPTISSPWLIPWSLLLFPLNYRKCLKLCKGWPHHQGGSNAFLSSVECSLEPD